MTEVQWPQPPQREMEGPDGLPRVQGGGSRTYRIAYLGVGLSPPGPPVFSDPMPSLWPLAPSLHGSPVT